MKKISLFLISFCFLLASCSKDDDATTLQDNSWILTKLEIAQCTNPDNNDVDIVGATVPCTAGQDDCSYLEISFVSGVYETSIVEIDFNGDLETDEDSGTYTITDNIITVCEGQNNCETYTFEIDGDRMIWNADSSEGEGCMEVATFTKK